MLADLAAAGWGVEMNRPQRHIAASPGDAGVAANAS